MTTARSTQRKAYTPAQKAKFAEKSKANLSAAHDRLVSAVETIVTGEDWLAWLKVSARFHKYSFNNVLLIAVQIKGSVLKGGQRWIDLGFIRQFQVGYAPKQGDAVGIYLREEGFQEEILD